MGQSMSLEMRTRGVKSRRLKPWRVAKRGEARFLIKRDMRRALTRRQGVTRTQSSQLIVYE